MTDTHTRSRSARTGRCAADGYLAGADAETFDLTAHVLEHVDERLLATPEGRRLLTRLDPLLFAVLYTPHLIRDDDGRITFADLHLALFRHGRRWLRSPGPRQGRHAFVAPRESGKSTILFKVLPLWAAAHGHVRFIAAFSSSGTQAETHLSGFKRELDTNVLLRSDFPDLCAPARRPTGGNVADSRQMMHTRSEFSFAARGLDSEVLGLVDAKNRRPDLIILDDVEPDESNYSAYQARKRLITITDTVLAMNERAHVALVGTVTMPGSIVHQLVKTVTTAEDVPDWITDEAFQVHYFEPIIKTADGRERSIWPVKWPVSYLASIAHTRSYKKNFLNQPVRMDGDYWTPDDFVYGDIPDAARVLLQIDPAVTDKRTSDYYGLAVIAYRPPQTADRSGPGPACTAKTAPQVRQPLCVVRHAAALRLPPARLRDRVLQILEAFPEIGAVRIEVNQGGDTWRSILHDLPVRLLVHTESAPKPVRAADLLNQYQRHRVLHAKRFPELEDQMTAYPDVLHDDLIDAVGAGVRYFIKTKPRAGAKTVNYTGGR
ncbi:hypothetical protein [Actinomadura miaoliensis]|uniref:Terminase large subunit gp17-like C-terminal domain-containing protein n=1 Tax=Actinomadura miaoliensis TaxID=430685 RepID=A0ABP7WCT5_9ACTN